MAWKFMKKAYNTEDENVNLPWKKGSNIPRNQLPQSPKSISRDRDDDKINMELQSQLQDKSEDYENVITEICDNDIGNAEDMQTQTDYVDEDLNEEQPMKIETQSDNIQSEALTKKEGTKR